MKITGANAVFAAILALSACAGNRANAQDPVADAVLLRINQYRSNAGLSTVTLDEARGPDCMAHAQYILQNYGTPATEGLNVHQEQSSLPGYTPGGAACGQSADINQSPSNLLQSVDDFMATLYHRRKILDPALSRIALGYATTADKRINISVIMLLSVSSVENPVAYPANGQIDVPLSFVTNEIPDPIPGGTYVAGYPITFQFPPNDQISYSSAQFVDGTGNSIDFYVSDPINPANISAPQAGTICMIPKKDLVPATSYSITLNAIWNGKAGRWKITFKTADIPVIDANDETALLHSVNAEVFVAGEILQYTVSSGEHFFFLHLPTTTSGVQLIVEVPAAVWTDLGSPNPDLWIGKSVKVLGLPDLRNNNTQVYVKLAAASRLQLISTSP